LTVEALYSFVDQIFVAQLAGNIALAGLVLFTSLESSLCALPVIAAGIGSSAIASRHFGAGDHDAAGRAFFHCYCLLICFGVAVPLIFAGPLLRPLLVFAGGSEATTDGAAILDAAVLYGRVILIFSFTYALQGTAHLLCAAGRPVLAMSISIISAVLNIAGDTLFIPLWGLTGAAVATTLGQALPAAWILWYLTCSKQNAIPINWKRNIAIGANWRAMLDALRVGIAPALNQLLNTIFSVIAYASLRRYAETDAEGDVLVTLFGVAVRPLQLAVMPGIGAALGALVLYAYNLGAKNYQRCRQTLYLTVVIAFGLGCVCVVLILLFAPQLATAFGYDSDSDASNFDLCVQVMRTVILGALPAALTYSAIQLAMAANTPIFAMLLSLGRQGLQIILMVTLPAILSSCGAADDTALSMIWTSLPIGDYAVGLGALAVLLGIYRGLAHAMRTHDVVEMEGGRIPTPLASLVTPAFESESSSSSPSSVTPVAPCPEQQ
jgi:Na+-driven multidrug efflux pump